MSSTLQKLLEKAKNIPTDNVKEDVECLGDLLTHGKIYFDFCFSRFQLVADKPEAQTVIQRIIGSENDPNYYLPFVGLLLGKISPSESAKFLFNLLTTDKAPALCGYILIQTSTNLYIKELCTLLFNSIPGPSKILMRDDLLFRYLGLGGNMDFVVNCLEKIPANNSYQFYQEFLLFFTWLIGNGCKSEKLLSLAIDIAVTNPDPLTLIQVIHQSDYNVPKAFADWIEQNLDSNAPKFEDNRKISLPIDKLPPLLRIQLIKPATSALNTPRFVRSVKINHGCAPEVMKRLISENDPKLVHDLAISSPRLVLLNQEIPIKYTLLAMAAIKNPNLVYLFLGEFCKLEPEKQYQDLISAACYGLQIISERNARAVSLVFPKIRSILDANINPSINKYLLLALSNAVIQDGLHSGFIWRDYKCILTPTETEYEDPLLVHNAITTLITSKDPDYCEAAEYHLLQLSKQNRPLVELAILQIPPEKLSKYPQLLNLRPKLWEAADPKTDMLQVKVLNEMKKPKTLFRRLMIATAIGAFPDAFHDRKNILKFAEDIFNAGKDIYGGKLAYIQEPELEEHLQSKDEDIRFAAVYAITMLIANGLLIPYRYEKKLMTATSDQSSLVRIIALFGISFCRISTPEVNIKRVLKDKKYGTEDMIGLGYCITSSTTQLVNFLRSEYKLVSKIPYLWAHVSEACKFLLFKDDICEGDPIGLAQYIHLTIKDPDTDRLVQQLLEQTEKTPEIFGAALLGTIPFLPFSHCPLILDERQRKIFEAIPDGEDYELLKAIIKHPRLAQKEPQKAETTTSTVDRIRNQYKTLPSSEFMSLLSALSNPQKLELISEKKEYSLYVAAKLNNLEEAGKLIGCMDWDDFSLKAASAAFKDSILEILPVIFNETLDIERMSMFLAFVIFEERIGKEKAVAMLPWMLSQIHPSDDLVKQFQNANISTKDIAHALILTNPEISESNFFELFDK
ncbi:hypothetical protein TVAG_365770 [Trichomonas vaginalis G3]|uniref:Uncharacterized protein n=1 Tax=Trichomonas vaginalis (strain ATCC PRA-98 / G3) TaxID=412133 RepID=A2DHM1_TRIV3|nr:armadillo (ARM) repeat-containing protein family [Trichomonas vaginalis G3]EAY20069.1 hypothetical protein TVAG_365770 [Trichomonas vaginalis G3]KAI5528022.1 armadillo (ARM) repeat-containing protein family [Trichomonas vaginalis G3]|eukprot:XP_001581055.1 hypothetical protein [Trichomonas vaginalis G3]